jgi:hypothetical protein
VLTTNFIFVLGLLGHILRLDMVNHGLTGKQASDRSDFLVSNSRSRSFPKSDRIPHFDPLGHSGSTIRSDPAYQSTKPSF